MSETTTPLASTPIDARRLWLPVTTLLAMLGGALMLGGEMRSLRLMAETGAKDNERLLAEIKQRPTSDGVRATLMEAMRPFDASLAKVEAQLQALAQTSTRLETRIEKLETTGNK